MSAGFGTTLNESFATVGPSRYSWRTCLALLAVEDWPPFCGRWPLSGSMRSGACSVAPNWEPRTTAGGYSYWPTPIAKDWCPPNPIGSRNSPALRDAIEFWPTPTCNLTRRQRKDFSPSLGDVVQKLWPTPTQQNQGRDWNRDESKSLRQLVADFGRLDPSETGAEKQSVQPNPEFLERLMGFPVGWSDPTMALECERWETQLAHLLPQWLTEPCLEGFAADALGQV